MGTILLVTTSFAAGDFSGGEWKVICHQGVTMVPSHVGNVLCLEVKKATGVNWHGELQYSPLKVASNEKWHLNFAARARNPFTFSVWLGRSLPPYDSLVPDELHFGEELMSQEWKTFAHTWVPVRGEPSARLNFVLGQIDNTVEISGVLLRREAVRPATAVPG